MYGYGTYEILTEELNDFNEVIRKYPIYKD